MIEQATEDVVMVAGAQAVVVRFGCSNSIRYITDPFDPLRLFCSAAHSCSLFVCFPHCNYSRSHVGWVGWIFYLNFWRKKK